MCTLKKNISKNVAVKDSLKECVQIRNPQGLIEITIMYLNLKENTWKLKQATEIDDNKIGKYIQINNCKHTNRGILKINWIVW